ncbi:MAG TPA: DNA mismatch repair endonuclease MutL [Gammaproteobacteria bacterium]
MNAAADPRIRILPPQIANQIAAGEVVERPASVVKELLENSLDAGARNIEVEIELGGVQLIRIRDDGHGIHRDDLTLALSPHATSKITRTEDLDGVVSLGFRGEALASIASVSRLQLSSRRSGEEHGWVLAPGESQITPASLPPGTEIEVRDLFYNTPARRKFLRSERTELSHVEEVIRRIALSRFDLALRFNHNGKQLLRLKPVPAAAEGRRRVGELLGSAFVEKSHWLDVCAGGFRLWGWLGSKGYSRSQPDAHYFYLNGRIIRDRLAGHAVRLAFGESIPEGRFPAYLLYLELDPCLVDVNVHPTKHEVRFREARQIHDFIYWAVKGALAESEAGDIVPTAPDITALHTGVHGFAPRQESNYRAPLRPAVAEQPGGYGRNAATATIHPAGAQNTRLGGTVCQLRSGYLLAERDDSTIVADLRALLQALHHSRLTAPGGEALLVAQPLLIPESLELGAERARLWRERGGALEHFGFEVGWLGDTLLVLRKVPAVVRSASMPALLQALEAWLERFDTVVSTGRGELLALLAHHAVPASLPSYTLSGLNALLHEYASVMPPAAPRPWVELQAGDWPRLFEFFS